MSSMHLLEMRAVCMEPGPCCRYPELTATDAHVTQYYMFYIHVAIMIYVGFGFLMTFLRCAAATASWHVHVLIGGTPQSTWALVFSQPCHA